jgi:transcriptional regulator with XRE-family HTH domain
VKRTLAERAAESIKALWERRAFTQVALAKRTGLWQSVVNRIIHGQQPVTLDVIEAVGELCGIDPAELLADAGSGVKVLNPAEAELLRYVRAWPVSTREALIVFLRFFANEPPVDAQLRRALEYLREMGKGERDRAVAYLLLLHEGGLSPDVRIALGLPATDDERQKRSRTTAKP